MKRIYSFGAQNRERINEILDKNEIFRVLHEGDGDTTDDVWEIEPALNTGTMENVNAAMYEIKARVPMVTIEDLEGSEA